MRSRRMLGGLFRAGALLAVLLAVAVATSVHAAERGLGERLSGFGDALMKVESFSPDPERRLLTVNGVELELMTLTTHDDVPGTLGHLRTLCKLGAIAVPEELTTLVAAQDERLPDGIFQQAFEHEGLIACIDAGKKLTLEELAEGIERVRQTGDLTALGALRFALARRSGQDTHVLVLWTRGPIELARVLPGEGDAPGYDPVGLPRPAASRRLLSAAEHQAPYGVTVYETRTNNPTELLREHTAEIARAGWTIRPAPEKNSVVARRDGRAVVVVTGDLRNGRTFLSIAELARQ